MRGNERSEEKQGWRRNVIFIKGGLRMSSNYLREGWNIERKEEMIRRGNLLLKQEQR